MSTSRREFVLRAAAGLGGLPFVAGMSRAAPVTRRGRAKRILILGGTGFIGPHQVRYALERGHSITLFNRGQTNPEMFPEVEKLRGDRAAGELDALRGKTWDAVIDNSASRSDAPEWVRDAATLLRGSAGQYVFISTRSVYRDLSMVPATKDAPLYTPENTPLRPGQSRPYGLAKAVAEQEALRIFGAERTTIVRPGLIIGPGDDTDRFTYWPVRIDRGGEILAPGDGSDYVQIIDARDLCEWVVRLVEQDDAGIFNGVGPATPRTFAELLYGIKAITSTEGHLTWVDTDFLLANNVRPYGAMPVWRPSRGEWAGFGRFDLTAEVEHGLTFRPLAVTARDTLDWYYAQPPEERERLSAGIRPEREAEVLAAWRQRSRQGAL
jgi:2'-hydroxyisoflavone reductase